MEPKGSREPVRGCSELSRPIEYAPAARPQNCDRRQSNISRCRELATVLPRGNDSAHRLDPLFTYWDGLRHGKAAMLQRRRRGAPAAALPRTTRLRSEHV